MFQKCWSVPWAGHFVFTVKNAHNGRVLASEQFWLVDGASKMRAMKRAVGSYKLWLGPSTSVEVPQPKHEQDTVSATAGGMVSMQLEATVGEGFSREYLEISLYRLDVNGRTLETRSSSAVGLDNDRFYKSWHMSVPGRFEVQIVEPKGPRLIAQGQFEITP
ncbi:MAG: hypothetical protein GY898_28950 [Proteobacteria bacterium]|nr:hypothetical protein [Pseudomonadota bacterium]